ncbi:MAG: prohibitin family protein [Armatimonadetes bacterium]|nr:prohibitin family protein [Armatimonadota bacterium]
MRRPSGEPVIDLRNRVRARLPFGGAAVPAVIIFLVVYVLFKSVVMVGAGERAVLFSRFTGVQQTQLGEGIHFVWPMIQDVRVYDVKAQTYTMSGVSSEGSVGQNDALLCLTSDGLSVNVELSVRFHVDPEQVWRLHQEIGPEYVARVVRPEAQSDARMIVSGYSVTDLYSSRRQMIQDEVAKKLSAKFQRSYIILDEALFRDIQFPQEFQNAIEQKQVAQQQAQQMVFVLQKARRERERKIIEAEGESQALRLKAQALMQNPQLIQYEYIQRLPPNPQTIITDGRSILNLGDLLFTNPPSEPQTPPQGNRPMEEGTP